MTHIAQKMKYSINDFVSKFGQIRSFLVIWSHLLRKTLMENYIFLSCDNIFIITFMTVSHKMECRFTYATLKWFN